MPSRRYPCRFMLFMMTYYAANAVWQGYMSLYLTSVGLSSAQTGAVFAAAALVSMFAQPAWGLCGDRLKNRTHLLRLLIPAASLSALTFLLTDRFAVILLFAALFSCFFTSIQPMGDSIILAALESEHQPFGPVRLAGGLMFAPVSLVFGSLLNIPGREVLTIYATSILCLLILPTTWALPDTPGYQASTGNRMSFAALLKNRRLMRLIAFMLPMQMTMGCFYTFFSPLFMSFEGAKGSLLGWCYFISALGEIPYLLLSDRLYERFGAGKLMGVSAGILTLRWLLLASTKSVPLTMASQLLHGWGFIVMTVVMAKHIARTVPKELQSSGQMLLAVVSFGVARVAGNLGGGWLADRFGMQAVFFASAALCAVTLAVSAPFLFRKEPSVPA